MTARPPYLVPAALLAAGLGTAALGFVYDVLFAGIPPQDAPPELRARFDADAALAAGVERAGLALVALSLLAFAVAWALRRRAR